jgi:aspartyl protease family protein
MTRVLALVVALLGVTVLLVWLLSGNNQVFGSSQNNASLIYSIVLLVAVMSSVILRWRGSLSSAAAYGAIWLAIFFALVLGYSYRQDFAGAWSRVTGEINPAMAEQRSPTELVLRKASDGHFYADVEVNGKEIRMLADTGASTVVLSEADAQAAGIDTNGLAFDLTVSTANGEASAARIKLDELRIGSIVRHDVTAAVSRGLSGSLLGMSFFSTLSRFEMNHDELVLAD